MQISNISFAAALRNHIIRDAMFNFICQIQHQQHQRHRHKTHLKTY